MECPVCKNITDGDGFQKCSHCTTDLAIYTIIKKLEKKAARRKTLIVFFALVAIVAILAVPGVFFMMSDSRNELTAGRDEQLRSQHVQIQTLTNELQMLMTANIDLRHQIEKMAQQLEELSREQKQEVAKEPRFREVIHIVRRGDNLKRLAARYYNDSEAYRKIMQDNNLRNPDHIFIGQRLKIIVAVTE